MLLTNAIAILSEDRFLARSTSPPNPSLIDSIHAPLHEEKETGTEGIGRLTGSSKPLRGVVRPGLRRGAGRRCGGQGEGYESDCECPDRHEGCVSPIFPPPPPCRADDGAQTRELTTRKVPLIGANLAIILYELVLG